MNDLQLAELADSAIELIPRDVRTATRGEMSSALRQYTDLTDNEIVAVLDYRESLA